MQAAQNIDNKLTSGSPLSMNELKDYQFTSESVSEGHPDKICDRISDAIVDLYMAADPESRVAAETMVFTDNVVIAGETRGPDSVTPEMIENAARQAIRDIGYAQEGFNWETVNIDVKLIQQSEDIAMGVDSGDNKDEGAGDQGIMFGFACEETDRLMPAALNYSHELLWTLAKDRHKGVLDMLGPDSKSQVSLQYKDGVPTHATSVVLSTQHRDGLSQSDVHDIIKPYIEKCLPEGWVTPQTELFINPTGRFVIGGPVGDCGLTGRKIIVDTYGGAAPHGGGAFSGKDCTKVDRSAAYAARYLAKNVVAAGCASKCTIQLSYAIGISKPLSVYVNTHGTGQVNEAKLVELLREMVDLSPRGIRTHLQLNKPIYTPTAAYGHFGRTPTAEGHFSWEKTDLVEALRKNL